MAGQIDSTNDVRIYTIGHSNLKPEELLRLLALPGIHTVVDVRSIPASRRHPQFNKHPLEAMLRRAGLRYAWMGDRIGGKRTEPEFLDEAGQVDPARLIPSETFQSGLRDLLRLAAAGPTAILCAEEDPHKCHRTWLIAAALRDRPVEILHIRRTGTIEPHRFGGTEDPQGTLFE